MLLLCKYICTGLQRLEQCYLNILSPTRQRPGKVCSPCQPIQERRAFRRPQSVRGSWKSNDTASFVAWTQKLRGMLRLPRQNLLGAQWKDSSRPLRCCMDNSRPGEEEGRTRAGSSSRPSQPPSLQPMAGSNFRSVVAVRANTRKRDAIPAAATTAGRVPGVPNSPTPEWLPGHYQTHDISPQPERH